MKSIERLRSHDDKISTPTKSIIDVAFGKYFVSEDYRIPPQAITCWSMFFYTKKRIEEEYDKMINKWKREREKCLLIVIILQLECIHVN